MFVIKDSPINKIIEGELCSKKCCSQNFSQQSSVLYLAVASKCVDISISDINYDDTHRFLTSVNVMSYKTGLEILIVWHNLTNRL